MPASEERSEILRIISERIAAIDGTIVRYERESELLREYRMRLTADVVSGKLDVREAAAKLPVDLQSSEPGEELVEDDSEMIEDEITEPEG